MARCASKPSDAERGARPRSVAVPSRERENKLFASEYEETTWSARTWTTFAAQKLSVALHSAAATEISAALNVPRFDGAELTAVAAMRGGG